VVSARYRYIKLLEADLAHADKRIAKLERKPRTRKPRTKTLIERTEKAAGRPAEGVTYHADGSRTIADAFGLGFFLCLNSRHRRAVVGGANSAQAGRDDVWGTAKKNPSSARREIFNRRLSGMERAAERLPVGNRRSGRPGGVTLTRSPSLSGEAFS
jgi:hypothetical protein